MKNFNKTTVATVLLSVLTSGVVFSAEPTPDEKANAALKGLDYLGKIVVGPKDQPENGLYHRVGELDKFLGTAMSDLNKLERSTEEELDNLNDNLDNVVIPALNEHQLALEEADKYISAHETFIKALTTVKADQEDLDKTNARLDEHDKKFEKTGEVLENLAIVAQNNQADVDNLNENLDEVIIPTLNNHEERLVATGEALGNLAIAAQNNQADIDNLNDNLDNVVIPALNEHQLALEEADKYISAHETFIKALTTVKADQAAVDALGERVTENESTITELDTQLGTTNSELGKLRRSTDDKFEKTGKALENLAIVAQNNQAGVDANKVAISKLESDKVSKKEYILDKAKLGESLDGLETKAAAEKKQRIANSKAIKANEAEIAKKADQTALDATNGKVATNEAEIAKKADQTALDATNAKVAENKDAIAKLDTDKVAKKEYILDKAKLGESLDGLETKVAAEKKQRIANSKAIKANEAEIAKKADQTALDATNSKVAANEAEIAKKVDQTALDATNGKVAANNTAISKLESDKVSKKEYILDKAKLGENLDGLETKVAAEKKQRIANSKAILANTNKNAEQDKKIARSESINDAQDKDIEKHSAAIEQYAKDIKNLDKNHDDLANLVGTKAAQADLDKTNEQVAENKAGVEANKAGVEANKAGVEANKAGVAANKAEIAKKANSDWVNQNFIRIDGDLNSAGSLLNNHTMRLNEHSLRLDNLDSRLNNLTKDMERGFAAQAALTGLFQPYNVGKFNVSAAVGGYKSKTALAVGTGFRFNENFAAKAGVAMSTNGGSASYNVGVNYEF